jgi:hypothetical protein
LGAVDLGELRERVERAADVEDLLAEARAP